MIVEFDKSFEKSLDKIKNKSVFTKIEKTISICESAKTLSVIPNMKKLTGYKTYYRIRLGEYRIGIEQIGNETIRFIIIAHRRDIYRFFPK
ncbi:type II toxin-antitoxin system RelE/ParE family toxin [Aquiflexum sp.]|uniref:type II toxin-antitoxin system RelE family toxin n=1 Tax=Aquiflexum sp. TaxID=1872584 RepID=UPI003593B985